MISLRHNPHRGVILWLSAVAGLVFLMVVVGGATRLTESGLSIVDWRPVTGALPPLSEGDWQAEFAKYKTSPEYKLVNRGMSLEDFKDIYYWEWGHRLLGRLIGFAFLVPFLWFLARRQIPPGFGRAFSLLFVLGGAQGLLGWYMVQSGLINEPAVSHYRLAAHLSLALLIFAGLLWSALRLAWPNRYVGNKALVVAARAGLLLVVFQIVLGALVAGLDAGHILPDWPWMGGAFIPEGLFQMSPAWRNFVDNAVSVQFFHRILAYTLAGLSLWLAWKGYRTLPALKPLWAVLGAIVIMQVVLGVMVLLSGVAVGWGVLHQAGGVLVFALYITMNYVLKGTR